MTDQPFPDRVTQLRRRWEADRTSRLFLQLAEEYRQLGRLREAVEVLDAGLVEHPGYLSALVAKGRCHVELDEPQAAREALERVVRQDATQAVASKLLVRAYIELGELTRARERLSLYALLHETDPDIAELRRRLEAPDLAPPVMAAERQGTEDPAPVAVAEEIGEVPLSPVRSDAMNEEIFDLGIPTRQPAPAVPSDDLFKLYEVPRKEPSVASAAPSEAEIFAGLGGGESRRRWSEGLAEGGVFDLQILELVATTPVSLPLAAPVAATVEPAPVFATPEPPALGFEAPVVAPARFEAPVEPASETETVTLAELYLRQGHREEARRILDQVLERDPNNAAARKLFAQMGSVAETAERAVEEQEFATRLAPLPPLPAAAESSTPPPVFSSPDPGMTREPTPEPSRVQRKVQILTAYLERLRRRSAPGVS